MSALCIVVALPCEARPWIDHYGLAAEASRPFRVYRSDDVALVVSGIGRHAAATATGFLAGLTGAPRTAVWINCGVAGHPHAGVGSWMLVARSLDADSRRVHLPSLPIPACMQRGDCITVGSVETGFADDALYDMEASGFFEAGCRFSFADLVQSVKVVSDNRRQGVESVRRDRVSELIGDCLPEVVAGVVTPLRDCAGELAGDPIDGELQPLLQRWHFSVSNHHRLRRLATDWRALGGAIPGAGELSRCRSAREVLARFEAMIDAHGPAIP